jgi:hypothetical protein
VDSLRVEYVLGRIEQHFKRINNSKHLTDADKVQIKNFYLEHFVAPDARSIVENHLREKLGKAAPKSATSNTHTHQDR